MDERTDPLLYYVHVPKTAGSSVNAMLARHFRRGHAHSESFFQDIELLAERARHDDWMSGHLPRPNVLGNVGQVTQRQIQLFSCVREPVGQLRSHYNWLLEIRHRGGNFYRQHSQRHRDCSDMITSLGSERPRDVMAVLREHPRIFRNIQSDVIIGRGVPWAARRYELLLERYRAIVPDSDVADLFTRMTGVRTQTVARTNTSSYHFDPGVFDEPELREFLLDYNLKDEMLYALVQRMYEPTRAAPLLADSAADAGDADAANRPRS